MLEHFGLTIIVGFGLLLIYIGQPLGFHPMKDTILIGKETTRGTVASSYALDQPYLGKGIDHTLTNHLGEVLSSATHPSPTIEVPLGTTGALSITPDVNLATVRDLIDMVTKRTADALSSLSIARLQYGATSGQLSFLGCLPSSMALQYSRASSPDASAILQGTWSFECMQPVATSALTAGSKGTGHYFKLANITLTINSVAATAVLAYSRQTNVALSLGPPNSSGIRDWIEEGAVSDEITITAKFLSASIAWQTLTLAGTAHAVSIVHATGTSNETVTETMGACQIRTLQLNEQDGTVTATLVIKPYHTGAAASTVWTYGSAVGASVLSL